MGKIIYLMGKSSSGKDTLYKKLMDSEDIPVKKVIPYTTRPIREGEQEGVEYYFTDEEGFQRLKKENKLIEDREYHTCHGLWRYFTVNDEQFLSEEDNYLMIGTLESYEKIRDYFGKEKMCPVLIELDDGIRLQRALDREKGQDNPKYQEMCRRFLADAEDFTEAKISNAGITKRFYNIELEKCFREIKEYVLKELKR